MTAADQEAGVVGRGKFFNGFADVLPDAADDPVRKEVDGSDGEQTQRCYVSTLWPMNC